ncbi:MAG: serine/threonine protein kinase [Planctomycetes bacterium]|nr:serine/threonine protein kinase [Planctomycetota bacterium]
MQCPQETALFNYLLDKEEGEESSEIQAHLAQCEFCRAKTDQAHEMLGKVKDVGRDIAAEPQKMPERIDSYRFIRCIGKGGMGEVWQALDETLNRHVAIKIIKASLEGNDDFQKRFLQEARTVALLDHSNIVRIYSSGKINKGLYIAMEFIPGLPLLQDIEGPLDITEVNRIFPQILNGLQAAHDKNIVHRDIKPSNIMVSNEGLVKLLDFGLAQSSLAHSTMTAPGSVLGTIAYMAPEIACGEKSTVQSDIYSLGMVLHQMLTGQRPYDGQSPFEVIERIKTENLSAPKLINSAVPNVLSSICMNMCARNKTDRYQSIKQVLSDWKNSSLPNISTPEVDEALPTSIHEQPHFIAQLPQSNIETNIYEVTRTAKLEGVQEQDIGDFIKLARNIQDDLNRELGNTAVFEIASEMNISQDAAKRALQQWKNQKTTAKHKTHTSHPRKAILFATLGLSMIITLIGMSLLFMDESVPNQSTNKPEPHSPVTKIPSKMSLPTATASVEIPKPTPSINEKSIESDNNKGDQKSIARERMRKDYALYTRDELREIERLYQVANKKWRSAEAKESLEKLISKYGNANRTGCAVLYLGQMSTDAEKEKYLQLAINNFSDSYYGDGVNVGAYARYLLAFHYDDIKANSKARELRDNLKRAYPYAINHRGVLLSELMK